jgi:hypothetical protein
VREAPSVQLCDRRGKLGANVTAETPFRRSSLPPLTVIISVAVISVIGAVAVMPTEFGRWAPVLPLFRLTVVVAGLVLPAKLILSASLILSALSVVRVHCVIEVANNVVKALSGSWMGSGNCQDQCDSSRGAKQSRTR